MINLYSEQYRGNRKLRIFSLVGFLWWSVFDALFPMLWFFPLCALEVSGYEPIIVLWFSPLLALWSPIRRALTTPPALLVLRLLTLVGVASYQSPTSLSRLIVLAVGNMFAVLALVSMWWGRSRLDRWALYRGLHTPLVRITQEHLLSNILYST